MPNLPDVDLEGMASGAWENAAGAADTVGDFVADIDWQVRHCPRTPRQHGDKQ